MKIGFIDYFLSEAHANTYPAMMRECDLFREKNMEFSCAYAMRDVSPYDGVTTDEWCAAQGIRRAKDIQEVVDASDCIVLMSPDNPELHEELAQIPLQSGKRVYIDKTFSVDRASAERMFALADRHGTKLFSTSALRYAQELDQARRAEKGAKSCVATGPYLFDIYAVHIYEMILTVMKRGVKRVMAVQNTLNRTIVAEFSDGREALFSQIQAPSAPFQIAIERGEAAQFQTVGDGYFQRFVQAMVGFFADGIPPVDPEETIELMGLLERSREALRRPFHWIEV